MRADLVLQNVRINGGSRPVTVTIEDGLIVSIGETHRAPSGRRIDGAGRLVLPALVDGHAHLDKTLWGLPWRPHSAGPGLAGLIANEHAVRGDLPPVADRAAALLATYLEHGTTRMRTHVDVDPAQGLTAVEGVLAAAERFQGRLDVEVVAFPQSGLLVAPGTEDLLDAAVRAGAALVGGLDPAGHDQDPVRHLDAIFGIAERHGVGIDLHLHDRGSLGRWQLELVVERTRAASMEGMVTVSHAFCLCDGDPAVDPLLELLAEVGISVATVAPGSVPLLPLRRMAELGIPVALGQDGVRDLWSPWGDGDMLHRVRQLAHHAGHRRDEDLARALELATTAGAAMLGVPDHEVAVGARADLMLVDAVNRAHAVVDLPPRDLVVSAGVPVAGPLVGSES